MRRACRRRDTRLPVARPIYGGSEAATPDIALPRRYFDFKRIEASNGLWDGVQQLRYDVYCRECKYLEASNFPDGRGTDEFDPHSLHFAATNERNEMVATLRLVLDSPLRFPLEHHAGTLSEGFRRLPREKTAEISRLILAKSYRRRANDGLYGQELGDPDKEAAAQAEAKYRRSQYPLILFGLFKEMYILEFLKSAEPELLEEMGEAAVLEAFQSAAREVPAYAGLLNRHGVDLAAVTDIESFRRLVPLTDKHNTFLAHPIHQLCRGGSLKGIKSIVPSSGHSGTFAFSVDTPEGGELAAKGADLAFEYVLGISERPTLVVNCYPMGLQVPTSMAVANAGVNADVAIVKSFASDFDQLIIVSQPLFVKKLLEDGFAQGVDWKRLRTTVVAGGEGFVESWRTYISGLLGIEDPDNPTTQFVASSMGAGELGLNLFHEVPETIRIIRRAYRDPALRQALFGEGVTHTPHFFVYYPMGLRLTGRPERRGQLRSFSHWHAAVAERSATHIDPAAGRNWAPDRDQAPRSEERGARWRRWSRLTDDEGPYRKGDTCVLRVESLRWPRSEQERAPMDPEIAAAFADTRRHFDVVGEQMRGDVRLLAEAFSTRIDRLEENLREELLRSQRELSAMIKFSYAELQRRLEGLERHHGELEARVRRLEATR